jgi:hypothetical protein
MTTETADRKTRNAAAALLRHYAYGSHPDKATSMADARSALCLAQGVALEDIDSSGYDRSERSYRSVRRSWVGLIEQHGWDAFYQGDALKRIFANWQRVRPERTSGDSAEAWLADGIAAHRAYWKKIGRPCNTQRDCDLHG